MNSFIELLLISLLLLLYIEHAQEPIFHTEFFCYHVHLKMADNNDLSSLHVCNK